MDKISQPLPIPNPDTEPFWRGCARGELLLQRCRSCGAYRHPPQPICHNCWAADHEWIAASGAGVVYSFVIVHQALMGWQGEVPYAVAIIELAEGPHLVSNVVGVGFDEIKIGMPVTAFFEPVADRIVLPKFKPAKV